jgi:phage gp46-like protein
MNDIQNFEGELLLYDTPDGGEVELVDDFFVSDKTFSTAVYISIMGGNKGDNGKVKNKNTWWGNTLKNVLENEKIISRFQAVIFSMPMTTKNIQEAESAAILDLQWVISDGIGDAVTAEGYAVMRNKFKIVINIFAKGENIYSNAFSLFWEAGVYGGSV